MEIVESFKKVGFTQHEAAIYLTLCQEGAMTGYETAKICGIARSNVYLSLAGLVEKGAARKIEGDTVKYIAVDPVELTSHMQKDFEKHIQYIRNNIPKTKNESNAYITISGEKNIISKMAYMIENAKERIYVSMAKDDLVLLKDEIYAATYLGLKVILITSAKTAIPATKVYYNNKVPGQIRLIVDSKEVLTGEIGSTSQAVYSENKTLVDLIKESLLNEIKLIEMNTQKEENHDDK